MIDYKILESFGSTPTRIRQVFTSDAGADLDHRKRWEKKLRSRIQDGALSSIKNYQFYGAADLAWDSHLISKEIVPLALYAQGKIDMKALIPALNDISAETLAKFVKVDDKGNPTGINVPAFHKVVVNLARSLVTKRVASLSVKYVQQTPFFNYEPLGTSYVAQLRGDVLTQRIEMMTNQYGYRHDLVQAVRDMLLYSRCVEFPLSSWEKERTYRLASGDAVVSKEKLEAYVEREGLVFKRPHPTRVFFDTSYPVSSLNTDTGCTYIGHWNVTPYRNVRDNRAFFNRSKIDFDTSFATRLVGYRGYWALYSPTAPINFPNPSSDTVVQGNERELNTGVYSDADEDATVMLTEYYEKVIPKDEGLGDYPFPVWLRLVVAGDDTVVYGEFMPCTPATVWEYNCHDGKILNNSFVHEAIPFNDQLSNQLTNLLIAQRAGLIKILSLDLDLIKDPVMVKKIREIVQGEAIYTEPLLIEYKGVDAAEMGMDPRKVISLAESTALGDPTLHYRSMMQLLALAERLLGTSANESAQSEPREVSASETNNIANSVNTFSSFMGVGVNEGVAAKKRMLYEAFIAKGETRVVVPVANRYMPETIKAAGFEAYSEAQEGAGLTENYAGDPKRVTVTGEKHAVAYDYNFSNRDGSERPSDPKAAATLVQLLQPLSQVPGFFQSVGKEQLFALLNSIIRLSGVGIDVKFDVKDGEDDSIPHGEAAMDGKNAIEQAIGQIVDAIEKQKVQIAQLEQSVMGMPSGMPPQPPAGVTQ